MGRKQLPKGVKLNFRIAGALSDEAGEALTDLAAMSQRPFGFFIREGIDLMIEKHAAEIRKYRMQQAKARMEAAE
jgi:hypothetical protein